jgi:hypothetical protein
MARTAVAAPDAFEDLFEFIDKLTLLELRALLVLVRARLLLLRG